MDKKNGGNVHMDGLLTVHQFASLVGKSPQSIYKRLNKIDKTVDNQVVNPIQPYVVVVDGQKMLKIQAISDLYGIKVEQPIQPPGDENSSDEVSFLRDQIRHQDMMIDFLNKELEKEREHNREKDRQLLYTLAKLAETQAALAAGQNAEKQKALAETLMEGQQMVEEERKEQTEPIANVDESKKQGLFKRIWAAITNK